MPKIGNVENAVTLTGRGNCFFINFTLARKCIHKSSCCSVGRRQICNMCNAPKFTDEERTGIVVVFIFVSCRAFIILKNVEHMQVMVAVTMNAKGLNTRNTLKNRMMNMTNSDVEGSVTEN